VYAADDPLLNIACFWSTHSSDVDGVIASWLAKLRVDV